MFDKSDATTERLLNALAGTGRPARQQGAVTRAGQAIESGGNWPDPVELAVGLEVRYLDGSARTTYFGDLDAGVKSESKP